MSTLFKRVELIANLAIIVVAVLLAVLLAKNYLWSRPPALKQPAAASQVRAGAKLSLPGVDWGTDGQTLVLALSTRCHFCTDSAPFYQRLAQERARHPNLRLVAVFPQAAAEGQEYLKGLGVNVDEVKQAEFGSLGVSGTPTLIIANNQGVVEDSWRGRLTGDKEAEVLQSLR